MKNTIYLLDRNIKWEVFKELQDRIVKDTGPVPVNGDRILWELLRDNRIHCWFADDIPNDMGISLKIPDRYKNWEVNVIKNNDNS